MGCLFSIPLLWISTMFEKPLVYNIRYAVAFAYYYLWRKLNKSRFDLYDLRATGQPFKQGFLVPKEEWKEETPNKEQTLDRFSDNAYCFATNPDNEFLVIHISRLSNENVQCSVLIRTSNGREFCLPEENTIQKETSEENTFGSSRVKLQCLVPMRKWRLFFNGILKESSSSTENAYKHVKFTLLWTASADVFDFSYDMSKFIVLDAAAKDRHLDPRVFFQRLKNIFNGYDHPGMFYGTLNIENEEERQIYLWGSRGRYTGELPEKKLNVRKIEGSFEDGSFVCLEECNYPGFLKSFPFGYFMRSDGFIFAIDHLDGFHEILTQGETKISFIAGEQDYTMNIIPSKGSDSGFQNNNTLEMKVITLKLGNKMGNGFLVERNLKNKAIMTNLQMNKAKKISKRQVQVSGLFTVPFSNERCQDSSLTGGKGSSLAKLMKLSSMLKSSSEDIQFTVPNGIVVTTRAYQEFIKGTLEELLNSFELDIWSSNGADISALCKKIVDIVSVAKMPANVTESVLMDLRVTFGEAIPDMKFSVRSSATGEDTDKMSAAGQMETFLGIKGFSEVMKAVAKCWASQFTFQAIEYKRRYGQKLNTPMAVVIQEMVPCESAGVMFTCDPVNGNPSFISITGNWGLGESVVSGSVEPDTVKLKKDLNNEIQFHSQMLGNKQKSTIMEVTSGTKDVEITEEQSKSCCISQDISVKLGRIAIEIEKYYGSSQDTEWGIIGENIFFFQSRPITSIDMDTDFEIKHFYDNFQRTKREFFSKANVGEVMPGACSMLGTDILIKLSDVAYAKETLSFDTQEHIQKPYFVKRVASFMSHWLFSMLEGFFRLDTDANDFTKSFIISVFGRMIDISEMKQVAKERFSLRKIIKIPFWKQIAINSMLFFAGIISRREAERVEGMDITFKNCSSAMSLFEKIANEYAIFADAFNYHMRCTFASSLWNLPILSLLARSRGDWDAAVFSDFANLIKTSTSVLSADVPAAMEDLADSIAKCTDPKKFKQLKPEEALEWLETSKSIASAKFMDFKKTHGHRCIKEFDLFSEPWGMNPKPLICTLQSMVDQNPENKVGKKLESAWKSISKLKIKVSLLDKMKLLFIVSNARRCVRDREFSKSVIVKTIHKLRIPVVQLAELMVKEGRIPRKELIFFLCVEELHQLLKSRSPEIVSRAFKRWKAHDELDKLRFPEIMIGIPKPITQDEEITPCENGFTMTGVPVSQGKSKAPARVIMSVNEADTIQNGDILITYSTDIAWSPYFPRLSGVVTELGGLISHGAVVAREYGLPCVVALHGASKAFKTGDIVILDGNKGTLQKVG